MKKICFLLFAFCFLQIIGYPQNQTAVSSQNEMLFSSFMQLSPQQLYDTAGYYFENNNYETALIAYSLFINSLMKDIDDEHQKRIAEAYNKVGAITYYMCDYRTSYEYFIKALLMCEKMNYESYKTRIYNNLANIYHLFNTFDVAKNYYKKALSLCSDSTAIIGVLNNLGVIEMERGEIDSAFYYLNQSLRVSNKKNNIYGGEILSSIAQVYQKTKNYDSAFYYFRLSLDHTKNNNEKRAEAYILSCFGVMFFEMKKIDSALFYIKLSNDIAKENNVLEILAENHLVLSKIEEFKEENKKSLEYFKVYANLKDSVFNAKNFSDINQLQQLYEVTKTNQQIEQLAIEQQINERTIHYQKIIQFITLSVLFLLGGVLLFIFFQKKRLSAAYKSLFEKNLEIMELMKYSVQNQKEKYQKSALTQDMLNELLDKIISIMEEPATICDPEFTVDKLAELAQSNQSYVSQVINTVFQKNFRSLLNSYRIRETQRLFSEPDAAKYTIESIALRVGFKSQSTFYDAFKEITGVTPNFYLKSIQKKKG